MLNKLITILILFFTFVAKSEENSLHFNLFTSNKEEKLFLYDNKQFVIEIFIEELNEAENVIFYGNYEITENKLRLQTQNLISTYFDTHLSYLISDYYVLEFEYKNTKISDLKLFKVKNDKLKQIKIKNYKDKTLTFDEKKIISNSNGVDDSKMYRDIIETSFKIKSNKTDPNKLIKKDNNLSYYINKDYILEKDSNLNMECYFYTATEVVNNKKEFVYVNETSFYDKSTKYANIKLLRFNNSSKVISKSSSFKSKIVNNKVRFKDLDWNK